MPWRNQLGTMSGWGQQNLGMGYLNPATFGFPALPSSTTQPPSGRPGGFFNTDRTDFGWNANTLNFGLEGLTGLGNLWGAWQSNRLARDQLDFTRNFARANLANQTQAYNTAIEDRSRSRAVVEGQTPSQASDWVRRNRLPDRNI